MSLLSYRDGNSRQLPQRPDEAPILTRVFQCLVPGAVVLLDAEEDSTLVVADVAPRRLVDMGQDPTCTDPHLVRRPDHRGRLLPAVQVVDIVADPMRHTRPAPDQNHLEREEEAVVGVAGEEDWRRVMIDDGLEAAVMIAMAAEADPEARAAIVDAL